jgi:hypothetical protein
MKKLLVILMLGSLTACTMMGDIMPTGPDSYMISSVACPACGGTTKSISMALKGAGEFCANQGKHMLKIEMTNDKWFNEAGETVLEFRCLTEDHPEYIRAHEKRDTDIIIKHR